MPYTAPPNKEDVLRIAREAIEVFSSFGLSCCLVGGVGCALYGNTRNPNDVDLVVLSQLYGQEELKNMLVNRSGSKFYLVSARTPGATYRVLWYRIGYSSFASSSCKVDILTPGIMNIPLVPHDKIVYTNNLPVMPLIPLMLLKLQAWEDHRNSMKFYHRKKQWTDIADLERLLPIAARRGDSVAKETWLPASFVSAAKRRIPLFLSRYSSSSDAASQWKQIGLEPEFTSSSIAQKVVQNKTSVQTPFVPLSRPSQSMSTPSRKPQKKPQTGNNGSVSPKTEVPATLALPALGKAGAKTSIRRKRPPPAVSPGSEKSKGKAPAASKGTPLKKKTPKTDARTLLAPMSGLSIVSSVPRATVVNASAPLTKIELPTSSSSARRRAGGNRSDPPK